MSHYFQHPQALCESTHIGDGTRIWAFAHVLPDAVIGRDCNICDNVFIENDVRVGDRVTVKCGVQLWDGLRVGDDVFIGPNATFTNDRFPRSRVYPEKFLETTIGTGASIGANATILPGINIGQGAMVGAGAVVTKTVPPHAIVAGNPARIVGYANAPAMEGQEADTPAIQPGIQESAVRGVRLYTQPVIEDLRGKLNVYEFERLVPFPVRRTFMVYDVPTAEVRGEHAHKVCHQFLVCVSGKCSVLADDGENRQQFLLDAPNIGVYLPPMVWGVQYNYSADARLLVFASEHYEADDYIRNYDDFISMIQAGN